MNQQQAILRAAFDEFATHGFSTASLNRIIDAAGISKGSMYYYFDSKEALFIAVMEIVVTGNMSGTRVAVVGAIATDMQSVARRS